MHAHQVQDTTPSGGSGRAALWLHSSHLAHASAFRSAAHERMGSTWALGAATTQIHTVNCLLTGEPNEPTEAAAPQAKG